MFIKNKEDFVCEKCDTRVQGTGYTNHCPKCMWSKHVDIDPGDRLSSCGGMMKPFGVDIEGQITYIKLKCEKCSHERRNKVEKSDNYDIVISMSKPQ